MQRSSRSVSDSGASCQVGNQPSAKYLLSISFFAMIVISVATAQSKGDAWPEADKLFHSDPQWLGADAAFSIDIGHDRVLWTFNDTFVARKLGDTRENAAFVRNTVAIQSGYDPTKASIKFYWRTLNGAPSEIFPSKEQMWMWPSSGIRVGDKLLLFCTRVISDHEKNSLGFKLVGWNAYWVTNFEGEPSTWTQKTIAEVDDKVIMGSAALRNADFIYLFGESEPEHDLYMARVRIKSLGKGALYSMQWWSGKGWEIDEKSRQPILHSVGTETSVQREPDGNGFLEINSEGFGASYIVMRRAPKLEGPWSAPIIIYRPPESNAPDAFVYAGKSHSELKGADLILTYATNGSDEKVAKDMTLYFPRFVKVTLEHQN